MSALFEAMSGRWVGLAIIGLIFWGVGWLSLRAKRVDRAALKSGVLALGIACATMWGWLQSPMFLGSRLIAFAPIVAWGLLIRMMSDAAWARFRRGRRFL